MAADWVILHAGALGDVVLTLQLALRLPGGTGGEIELISRTDPGDLSVCRPAIRRRCGEGLGLHWLFSDDDAPPPESLRQAIAGRRVLSALAGRHTIVHHRIEELGPAALYSLDTRPHGRPGRHITQQWQTQLESQGLLVPKCVHQRQPRRCLGVPDELRADGRRILRSAGLRREVVLVHPGSGGRHKCWPVECFAETIELVRSAGGFDVGVVLGPVEAEMWTAGQRERLSACAPLIANPTPAELVGILAAAGAFLGNDAGPAHLAALLGTPVTVLFGPTAASVWHPLGPDVRIFEGRPDQRDWHLSGEAIARAVVRGAGGRVPGCGGGLSGGFATRRVVVTASDQRKTGRRAVVSGASGLIGRAVVDGLRAADWQVDRLVRGVARSADEIPWSVAEERIDSARLAGCDAVIHLAGDAIAAGRWTADKKARIRDSRVGGTRLLAMALAGLEPRPSVVISASAVGYYGNRGDEVLTEDSARGGGFLAEVCGEWEAAADPARAAGIRVVNLRIGMVLSRVGGALPAMLGPFKLGLGGRLGGGRQFVSWITLGDLVRLILHAIEDERLVGPCNATAPNPVRNAEFTGALARVIRRPAILPAPGWGLRLLLGEMADELLLASVRAVPERAQMTGFAFDESDLVVALRTELAGK